MISAANEEIRSQIVAAERRRREKLRLERPFVYLDMAIGQLEALHLAGKKRVPKRFVPHLMAVDEMLPEGAHSPSMWRTLIRDAIEQCFDLQEQLLRLRDPERVGGQELELERERAGFSLVQDMENEDLRESADQTIAVA